MPQNQKCEFRFQISYHLDLLDVVPKAAFYISMLITYEKKRFKKMFPFLILIQIFFFIKIIPAEKSTFESFPKKK